MANGSPNILERAGDINYSSAGTHVQTQFDGGTIRHRTIDENAKLDITCEFPVASRATIAAVQAFYAEHRTGYFDFKVPDAGVGLGAVLQCEFIRPPEIRRQVGRPASVSVQIRRTLLID